MKPFPSEKKAHVFVCCRIRDNKPSCGAKGAESWVKTLKMWAKENDLKDRLQISKSSCLGHCDQGIALCVYPQNLRYVEATPDDTLTLQNELLELLNAPTSMKDSSEE